MHVSDREGKSRLGDTECFPCCVVPPMYVCMMFCLLSPPPQVGAGFALRSARCVGFEMQQRSM